MIAVATVQVCGSHQRVWEKATKALVYFVVNPKTGDFLLHSDRPRISTMRFALLLATLLPGIFASGQTPNKTKIYVDCTCEDAVGSQYATALRDAIARSPRYVLAPSSSEGEGKDKRYNWTLSIVSVDEHIGATTGSSSALSVVLQMGLFAFDQHVQTCGLDAIDKCVAAAMAFTDGKIQSLNNP